MPDGEQVPQRKVKGRRAAAQPALLRVAPLARAVAERVAAALLAVPAGAVHAARARGGEVLIDGVREVTRVERDQHVEHRRPVEAHLLLELIGELDRPLRELPGGVTDRGARTRMHAAAAAPPCKRPHGACGWKDHAHPRAGRKSAAGEHEYSRNCHGRGHQATTLLPAPPLRREHAVLRERVRQNHAGGTDVRKKTDKGPVQYSTVNSTTPTPLLGDSRVLFPSPAAP